MAAERLYQRGCELGAASACMNSAIDHRDGLGMPRDRAGARALFDRACTLGNAGGCKQRDLIPAR